MAVQLTKNDGKSSPLIFHPERRENDSLSSQWVMLGHYERRGERSVWDSAKRRLMVKFGLTDDGEVK